MAPRTDLARMCLAHFVFLQARHCAFSWVLPANLTLRVVVELDLVIQEAVGALSNALQAEFSAMLLLLVEVAQAPTSIALILELIHFALAVTLDVDYLATLDLHLMAVGAAPTTVVCAQWGFTIVARMHLQVVGQMVVVAVAGVAARLLTVAVGGWIFQSFFSFLRCDCGLLQRQPLTHIYPAALSRVYRYKCLAVAMGALRCRVYLYNDLKQHGEF